MNRPAFNKLLVLHLIFSGYVLLVHPFVEKYIFQARSQIQTAPVLGSIILAVIILEHFASRAKIRELKQQFTFGDTIMGFGVFLYIMHMLALLIMTFTAVQFFSGSDVTKLSPWITMPILFFVVLKDFVFVIMNGNKGPKWKPAVTNTILLIFALCAHSVFWGVMVQEGNLLSSPLGTAASDFILAHVFNVLGIALLFMMSYSASRTLVMLEEKLQAPVVGKAKILFPYFIAITSTVISIYL